MAIATTNATPAELRNAGSGRLLLDAGRALGCLVNVMPRSDTGRGGESPATSGGQKRGRHEEPRGECGDD